MAAIVKKNEKTAQKNKAERIMINFHKAPGSKHNVSATCETIDSKSDIEVSTD